ncbi:hypothetical protein NMG46_13260 [Mesorhizobium sp. LMG 17147]|uniref:hypothetical protein n=1 Tax=Mesorhizobium sp. LMG 17147 TaxID=2963091 RepID=UPI0020C95AC3|nr:hypothetical protein [Mesorhizobium sp. LMG 17147]MCP9231212.1 hypothetical protein [Mesorhizobium sp. LMG 17147]
MRSEIFSFINAGILMMPDRAENLRFRAHASRVLAVSMSGEKSGVKSERNQTGADLTSFPGYAAQHRDLNKV